MDADVTQILSAIDAGDPDASEALLPLVYEELRLLAATRLAGDPAGRTLQATALVHEAYLRLVDPDTGSWNGRGHFFGAAAEAMRRILVDRARRQLADKRGAGRARLPLDEQLVAAESESQSLLDLHEALMRFEEADPAKASLVKLRHFAGLTEEQAARALGISRATAARQWAFARAWLYDEILRVQRTRD